MEQITHKANPPQRPFKHLGKPTEQNRKTETEQATQSRFCCLFHVILSVPDKNTFGIKEMVGEQTNNSVATLTNNQVVVQSFELPADIDNLIDASETYSPEDVWMEYLATLPTDTTREELHNLKSRFVGAVAEYMGVDE